MRSRTDFRCFSATAAIRHGQETLLCRVRERRRRRPLPSEPCWKVALHTAQADPYPPCSPDSCCSGCPLPLRVRLQCPSTHLTCPVAFSAGLSVVVGWSTRPMSAAFRRGPPGPIHRVMDSPCLSAGGLRFLGHPVPAAGLGRPSEDRPAYWLGPDRIGVVTFRTS